MLKCFEVVTVCVIVIIPNQNIFIGGGGNRKQPQSLSSGGGEGAGESEEGYEDVDISDALKNGSTEDIGIGDGVNHERSSPESIVLPPGQ